MMAKSKLIFPFTNVESHFFVIFNFEVLITAIIGTKPKCLLFKEKKRHNHKVQQFIVFWPETISVSPAVHVIGAASGI